VIPNLTVGALAIPAKVAVGNRLQGKVLKAAQQPVFFGDLMPLAEDFDRHEPLVWIKEIGLYLRYLSTLFGHAREYNFSRSNIALRVCRTVARYLILSHRRVSALIRG
jgi:hypothetical protein